MSGSSDPAALGVFALLVLAGEVLPVSIPRRDGFEEVTVSAPFALAAMALFGTLPALAMYGVAVLVVGVAKRRRPGPVAVDVAQAVLALGAAAASYAALGGGLAALLVAALAFLLVDGLLSGRSSWPRGPEDIRFHACVGGMLLVLAPVAVACHDAALWLAPILFVPVVAFYLGARQAVESTRLALHDPLTGLPNRGHLVRRLESWIAAGEEVTLIAVGLDELPALLRTLGRERGEALARALACRLAALASADCFAAALAPDELVVAHRGRDFAGVSATVRFELEAPVEIAGLALQVSPRCGIANHPRDADGADALVRAATTALCTARDERADMAVHVPDRPAPFVDRVELASQLRRALDGDELVVHYQPKCPLHPGQRAGAEALVRWDHPELGRLAPQSFVPLAERLGLIESLTRRVLSVALRQCADWRAAGIDAHVAVNLSARCLLDRRLPRFVDEHLAAFDVPADCLQLEITESELVADVVHAREMLERLAQRGVRWAIDDFGTGYSSLAQLQRLPVDELKIDRAFVQAMPHSASDDTIVRSTIDLARNLGLSVTAEGVESEEVLLRLAALGCDFAQGYHLGRPVPGSECGRTLARFARRAAYA